MDQAKTIKIDQITPLSQDFQLHFEIIQIIIKDNNQILCRIVDQTGIVNARFDKFANKLQKSGVYFMTNLKSNLVNGSLRVQMTAETVITREPDIIGFKDKVNDISKKKFDPILQVQENKQKKIEQKRIQVVKIQGIITENQKKQEILIPLSKQQAELQIKLKNQFYKKQKGRIVHKQKNHFEQVYKEKNRSNESEQQRRREEKEKQEQKQRQKYRQKQQYKQKQTRSQSNRNNNHRLQQKHGSKYEEKILDRQTKSKSVLYRQKQEKRNNTNQQKQIQKQKIEQQKYRSKERAQKKYEEKKSNDFHYQKKYNPKPQNQKPAQIKKEITENQEKKINQVGKNIQINSKAVEQDKLKMEGPMTIREEKDELERQNQQKRQLAFSKGQCIEIINITTQVGNCVNIKAWITRKQRNNQKTNQKERLIADSTGAVWLRTDKMNLESEQYYQIDNLEVCKEDEKIFLKEYEITQARRLEGTISYTNREINSRE